MKYINDLESAKEKIINLYPEFINSTFIGYDSGWCNYAVKVDNKYIFRFSRNYESYRILKLEYDLLTYLNTILPSNIKVPNYIYFDLSDTPFVGYEMIKGKFLTKEVYDSLSSEEKNNLAKNMTTFLNTLHSIDINKFNFDVINPIENYKMRYEEFKNVCYKYFDDELKQATDNLFNNYFNNPNMYNYKPTVIHGDLSEDHIILTDDGVGIIDFGDTRVFDASYDFSWANMYDDKLYNKIIDNYINTVDDYFKERDSEFYIKIIPYYGISYGDETNNQELIDKCINDLRKNFNISITEKNKTSF